MTTFVLVSIVALSVPGTASAATDLYGVLGLERGALERDIRKAYRSLSLLYHPDKQRNRDEAERRKANSRFVDIQLAYSTLSDQEMRRVYDLRAQLGDEITNDYMSSRGRGTWDSGSSLYAARLRGGFQQAELITSETAVLNDKNIERFVFNSKKPWIVQIYDDTSDSCQRVAPAWEQTAHSLDGIAKLGRINAFKSPQLVQQLGDSVLFSKAIRRSDLPVVFGFRAGCRKFSCAKRYRGIIKENLLTSFVSRKMLRLPKLNVRKINLKPFKYAGSGKVEFIFVSNANSEQSLIVQYLAKEYEGDVTVSQIYYERHDREFWLANYGFDKFSMMIILRKHAVPVVEQARSSDQVRAIFAKYRFQPIPKLTNHISREIGCWPGGLKRACFIIVGTENSKSLESAIRRFSNVRRELSSAVALVDEDLAFGWTSGSTLAGALRTRFSSGSAAVVVLLFDVAQGNLANFDIYRETDENRGIVKWMKDILQMKLSEVRSLDVVPFDAIIFPDIKLPVWRPILISVLTDISDFVDACWFLSVESGIIPLFGTIWAIVLGNWLRRLISVGIPWRQTMRQTRPAVDSPWKTTLIDVYGVPLKHKSVYVAMIFTPESNRHFRELAKHFRAEKLLCFIEADSRFETGWELFRNKMDIKSNIVVWHPSRDKFQVIGDVNDRVDVCARLNSILDGLGEWTRGNAFWTDFC